MSTVENVTDFLDFFNENTPFAKHFDMDKLFKILWRGRKQGRCGRTSLSLAWEIAHIYLVFAHAREISKVCSYRSPWQKLYNLRTCFDFIFFSRMFILHYFE